MACVIVAKPRSFTIGYKICAITGPHIDANAELMIDRKPHPLCTETRTWSLGKAKTCELSRLSGVKRENAYKAAKCIRNAQYFLKSKGSIPKQLKGRNPFTNSVADQFGCARTTDLFHQARPIRLNGVGAQVEFRRHFLVS